MSEPEATSLPEAVPEAKSSDVESPGAESSGEGTDTQAGMKWYVLRVASNKEEQVRAALRSGHCRTGCSCH